MSKSSKRRERCEKLIRANLSMDKEKGVSFRELYNVSIDDLIKEELHSFTNENFSYREIQDYYKTQNKSLKEKLMSVQGLLFLNETFNCFKDK